VDMVWKVEEEVVVCVVVDIVVLRGLFNVVGVNWRLIDGGILEGRIR